MAQKYYWIILVLVEIGRLVQFKDCYIIVKPVCLKVRMSCYFNNSELLAIDITVF